MSKATATVSYQAAGRAGWVHEIKQEGYHLVVRRDGAVVRLLPCGATTATPVPLPPSPQPRLVWIVL